MYDCMYVWLCSAAHSDMLREEKAAAQRTLEVEEQMVRQAQQETLQSVTLHNSQHVLQYRKVCLIKLHVFYER